MASGNHARLYGLNRRGLKRAGLSSESIQSLRTAYRILFKSGLRLEDALTELEGNPALSTDHVRHLITFIRASHRGITR